MLADPVLQEPNRRAATRRGVAAQPVVKELAVPEQVNLCLGSRWVGRVVQLLVLQVVEEAFGWRDVLAVALAGLAVGDVVRPPVLGICRRLVAPLVPSPHSVLKHQSIDPAPANALALTLQLTAHAPVPDCPGLVECLFAIEEGFHPFSACKVGEPRHCRDDASTVQSVVVGVTALDAR